MLNLMRKCKPKSPLESIILITLFNASYNSIVEIYSIAICNYFICFLCFGTKCGLYDSHYYCWKKVFILISVDIRMHYLYPFSLTINILWNWIVMDDLLLFTIFKTSRIIKNANSYKYTNSKQFTIWGIWNINLHIKYS